MVGKYIYRKYLQKVIDTATSFQYIITKKKFTIINCFGSRAEF